MGARMLDDDIYIGTVLELFNLRFGLEQEERGFSGGVSEMTALQREFRVFRQGRTFADSAKLLGLGGLHNNRAKNRWFTLLGDLPNLSSNREGEDGDKRIVNALIANFDTSAPLPCFMKAQDSRPEKEGDPRVLVFERDTPIFYIDKTYLTISLPMKPRKLGG
jgi:hypothetical protein